MDTVNLKVTGKLIPLYNDKGLLVAFEAENGSYLDCNSLYPSLIIGKMPPRSKPIDIKPSPRNKRLR